MKSIGRVPIVSFHCPDHQAEEQWCAVTALAFPSCKPDPRTGPESGWGPYIIDFKPRNAWGPTREAAVENLKSQLQGLLSGLPEAKVEEVDV